MTSRDFWEFIQKPYKVPDGLKYSCILQAPGFGGAKMYAIVEFPFQKGKKPYRLLTDEQALAILKEKGCSCDKHGDVCANGFCWIEEVDSNQKDTDALIKERQETPKEKGIRKRTPTTKKGRVNSRSDRAI